MAHCFFFLFVTVILFNSLVSGQSPTNALAPNGPATSTTGATTPTIGAGNSTPGASLTSAPPPLVQASPECASLQAKNLADMPFSTGESIWWVGKLWVNPNAPTSAPQTTTTSTPGATVPNPGTTPTPAAPCGDNTCSINSYKPESCQAIKMLVSRNEDGSICLKEAVFNKVTNSASLIKNTWLPADPSKAIIKQMYGYYGTMDQSGIVNVKDPGPTDVKTAQSSDFVLIGTEGGEWALFSSCCKSVVFVLYNDVTVSGKMTKSFDQAIAPLLQPLGVKPEDLKDIPTDFTIKVDNFIPTLPPIAAAAAELKAAPSSGDPVPGGSTPMPAVPPQGGSNPPQPPQPPAVPPPTNPPPP